MGGWMDGCMNGWTDGWTTGKFSRFTPVREFHVAFRVPYIYNYITKLSRQQAEVVQNHENANVGDIGKRNARHRIFKIPILGCCQAYGRSSD
jgi:hypothetical protein